MITLPNWLLGILLILAAYGVAIMAFVIWMRLDEWRTKRKDAHKDEDEYRCICTEAPVCRSKAECKQAREYKEICDWLIEEIEKEIAGE